ncbi:MAG: 4-hydroxythreonine-4-phosphate dehydrogenase PdxA [Alphaproteobacteria bacterium]|nr:4-hydroxythreonine-4-phosphate dehydrogenase PdxA [Alphaproteobacteria bacterium]
MSEPVAPVVVTMGDPAGIGGDCLLKAWTEHRASLPPFFVIDDPGRLGALALKLKLDCSIQTIADPSEAHAQFEKALPVLPVDPPLSAPAELGTPDSNNASAVIGAIDKAVMFVQNSQAAAMVTNPIHKASMQDAGFAHPGHTEYLGQLAGPGNQPVMMLASAKVRNGLRVVPVTIHLAHTDAAAALTTDIIISHGTITAAALQQDFGLEEPRIAVAALNPHAGEDGKFGDEEARVIAPAVAALQDIGVNAFGPLPADTLFHTDARGMADAVLCMYHDQALIPLKTLDFYGGVNVTLGLPFVRTSPDHGTAFDLAGTGKARCDSLVAALRMAAEIANTRARL